MLDPGHIKVSKILILRNYKLGGRTKFLFEHGQTINIQGVTLFYKEGKN